LTRDSWASEADGTTEYTERRNGRVPLTPGSPRESTLAAWHRQGLPKGVAWYEYLMEVLGIPYEPPAQPQVDLDVDFKMIPPFACEIVFAPRLKRPRC
jgi:hypothetical protein